MPCEACLAAAPACVFAAVFVISRQSSGVQELTNDRLGSEADLTRLLGTLRYLHSLKVARQQVESVAAAANSQGTPEQHEASTSATPGQTFELYARQMCVLSITVMDQETPKRFQLQTEPHG